MRSTAFATSGASGADSWLFGGNSGANITSSGVVENQDVLRGIEDAGLISGSKMVTFIVDQGNKMDASLKAMKALIANYTELFAVVVESSEEGKSSSSYFDLTLHVRSSLLNFTTSSFFEPSLPISGCESVV